MDKIYSDIKKFIENNDNFIITAHYSIDGDNIGSSVAFYKLFERLGKKSVIVNEDPVPEMFKFLIKDVNFKTFDQVDDKFSNAVVLDVGSYERMGKVSTLFNDDVEILNIDHHISNKGFGGIDVVCIECAATAEIVTELFDRLGYGIDEDIATALYVGILTDTGGFRYSNTNARVLESAARLCKTGINPSLITEKVIYSNSFNEIKTAGEIISKVEFIEDGKVALLFHDNTTNPILNNDLVIDLMNSIKEANITLFVRKVEEGLIKSSFRSKTDFDLAEFTAKFGGGGHKKAAGLRFRGTFEEYKEKIINTLLDEVRDYDGNK